MTSDSKRASFSKSLINASMRAAWVRISCSGIRHLAEGAPLAAFGFHHVHIAAQHRQRSAQFVRGVGDKVAAGNFHPAQLGDVAHDQQALPVAIWNQAQRQGGCRRIDVRGTSTSAA